MRFRDKTVLITGGSRGIGRATAQAFAEEGAVVVINYQKEAEVAKKFVTTLPNGPHHLIQANVGDPSDAQKLVEETIRLTGRLDILVNNAGIHEHHPIDQVDYETWQREWEKTIQVNLFGPANTMYWATQHMIRQGGGRIVNVSSRGAFRGEPDQPAYGASKAGLNALSQSLAQKLAPYHIYIGVVAPCFTETDMAAEILAGPRGDGIRKQSPTGRVAKPEEVAKGILLLAEPGTEYMTGAILDVNGASYLRS